MSFSDLQTTTPIREAAGELAARLAGPGSTLLAVWAHPDDESVLGAGLMASIARLGGRVVNVTATLGEHGTPDPIAHPPERLARRRHRELSTALAHLGAEPPIVLGDEDGTCADIPLADGIERVGAIVDRVRPDVVLSFGPDGVTGHPDHIAVGRWCEGAVAERDDEIALVATAAAEAWPLDVIDGLHRIDAFWPGAPARIDEMTTTDVPTVVTADGAILDRKLAALAAHRSQMTPLRDALGPAGFRRLASTEAYRPVNDAARRRLGTPAERSTPSEWPAAA